MIRGLHGLRGRMIRGLHGWRGWGGPGTTRMARMGWSGDYADGAEGACPSKLRAAPNRSCEQRPIEAAKQRRSALSEPLIGNSQ